MPTFKNLLDEMAGDVEKEIEQLEEDLLKRRAQLAGLKSGTGAWKVSLKNPCSPGPSETVFVAGSVQEIERVWPKVVGSRIALYVVCM